MDDLKEITLSWSIPKVSVSYRKVSDSFPEVLPTPLESRYKTGKWCSNDIIQSSWLQKSRLDPFFDRQDGRKPYHYKKAREQLFELTVSGSHRGFLNRAADKLWEVLKEVNITNLDSYLSDIQTTDEPRVVLDICSSPGSWADIVLKECRDVSVMAMSLSIDDDKYPNTYYPKLLHDSRFTAVVGEDKTGNVYLTANLQVLSISCRAKAPSGAVAVLADGGFGIRLGDKGEHMENYQESMSHRIVLSECLATLLCLREGGLFVCKFFDSLTEFTVSLIASMSSCFKKTTIVKAARSRLGNSERYLVCQGFLKEQAPPVHERLALLHGNDALWTLPGHESYPLRSPASVLQTSELQSVDLSIAIKSMNETILSRQARALRLTTDLADRIWRAERDRYDRSRSRPRHRPYGHQRDRDLGRSRSRGQDYRQRDLDNRRRR
eukprot:gnl/Dysnectes_brevis/6714_a10627_531.p1 GENE.gnl/Dysnectes_brevis/6714_a10627_531~~gnl/Dysnectes_brevis/6714_a10627_531.p1  ORF type:complete len:437 (+),score=21.29 gnl/Dysnectes_brevis/6714_a10627_531:27-1337(+)